MEIKYKRSEGYLIQIYVNYNKNKTNLLYLQHQWKQNIKHKRGV